MYRVLIIVLLLVLSIALFALPESLHPYPSNSDDIQFFFKRGAIALEMRFSKETLTEAGHDFIIISDDKGELIGVFSGRELAGQRVLVQGDTVRIKLVSDKQNSAYGYSLADMRMVFNEDYFQPCQVNYQLAEMLVNDDLKQELYDQVKGQVCLGYKQSRHKMFGEIDNENGYVRCVYTDRWVQTDDIPNGTNMNTEHTWPKSKGAKSEPAKSDIFHLFPTDSYTNAKRSSFPFGEVTVEHWSKGGSVLGLNAKGHTVFFPRADHRGNVARAIFYFSIRYRLNVPNDEEKALRAWNQEDPVDEKEKKRNDDISRYQKTRNPFIDHPEYIERIDDF